MSNSDVAVSARQVQETIIVAPADVSPGALWRKILVLCGQTENSALSTIDLEECAQLVGAQVQKIVAMQPLPADLNFIYFGLYESVKRLDSDDIPRVGFYFAGGTGADCNGAIENGSLSYFPAKRRIHAEVLDRIREQGLRKQDQREHFEWLLLWAAAAVLAKSVVNRLQLNVPAFVGFDSGDYFQINE